MGYFTSGLSMKRASEKTGIPLSTLYYWAKNNMISNDTSIKLLKDYRERFPGKKVTSTATNPKKKEKWITLRIKVK